MAVGEPTTDLLKPVKTRSNAWLSSELFRVCLRDAAVSAALVGIMSEMGGGAPAPPLLHRVTRQSPKTSTTLPAPLWDSHSPAGPFDSVKEFDTRLWPLTGEATTDRAGQPRTSVSDPAGPTENDRAHASPTCPASQPASQRGRSALPAFGTHDRVGGFCRV